MKYNLLLLSILACSICGAQRISSKSAKIDVLAYPRLNTDKTQTININIDNSFSEIDKDSLRGYSGTMDVLTGNNGLRLGKFQGKSKNEMMIVNGTADYNFDISFGQPKVLEKRVNSITRAGSTANYYAIDYEYPAIIKITDSKNNLVDIWKLNPNVYVDYGASNVTKRIYDGPVTTILTYSNIFNSESDLEDAYDSYGESVVEREALVLQLKQAIEDIDDRLYFFEIKDDFDVYTAKGRKHDYSELDDAQDLAIKAIESQNFDDLKQSISIWEKYLEQADEDDKSKINLDIKEGLLSNLALGNMYLNNFNDALSYAAAYKKQIEANSNKVKMIGNTIVQTTGLQNESIDYVKANYLLNTVYGRAEAFKNNNSKSIDFDQLKDGIDLKKEIGRQSKNYQYDLFENTNSYNKFSGELLNYVKDKGEEYSSDIEVEVTGPNPYASYLQNVLGTPNKMLKLSFLDLEELSGKPFPNEIVDLTMIGMLDLTYFEFTSLPENFGDLKNLTDILLARNNLRTLPNSFGDLENLNHVDFSYNKLVKLPETIGNLKELKTLNLSNNELTSLPASTGKLTSLKNLDLKNNQLTSLPQEMKQLVNLKKINLKGNNFNQAEQEKISNMFPEVKIKF